MPVRKSSLFVLVFALGCNGASTSVAPVSGTVTLDGEPLAGATVSFEPIAQGEGGEAGVLSTGKTGPDGKFTLTTTDDRPGAVVGEHRVRITTATWAEQAPDSDDYSAEPPEEAVPAKYNTQTELRFTVPAGGTQAADFQLTSE